MRVLKFGGSSLAGQNGLHRLKDIVLSKVSDKCVVVVSAFSQVTNTLEKMLEKAVVGDQSYESLLSELETKHLDYVKDYIPIKSQSYPISFVKRHFIELESCLKAVLQLGVNTPKIYSQIVSYGEILSSNIVACFLKFEGLDVVLKDARELLFTKEIEDRNIIHREKSKQEVVDYFSNKKHQITIVPGFIACNEKGETTTIGRGGSDLTASLIGNFLDVDFIEIWTDVSGIYTANPKFVSSALPISRLSYYEAMELSHYGAKVIYPPTIQPLVEKGIPLYIKNTFSPRDQGSLINDETHQAEYGDQVVKGISHIDQVALINIEGTGMVGVSGVSKRLFVCLAGSQINIILITQASSEYSVCLAVKQNDAIKAKEIIENEFAFEIGLKKINPVTIENDMANIAVVGDNMKSHQGISGKLFSALGANNINIRAIAQGSSERNISIVIDQINVQKALNTLHENFFEEQVKQLNLFITGVGNVGGSFLEQLKSQENYLSEKLRLKIRVRAISNSKKMILSENPIDLTNWKSDLINSKIVADRAKFFDHITNLNLRNSIFVDNTASPEIASEYQSYLSKNVGVVTCNKIACAGTLENYLHLKRISLKFGTPFLFETNVGASLPIIDTLNNLVASGDKIIRIQAILSGSLNFIFNHFKKETTFHDVVLEAKKLGFTEPNPIIDLCGLDVARKILILARESGLHIEFDDIEKNNFLPIECIETNNEKELFHSLKKHEPYFQQMLDEAKTNNARLKYMAQLVDGKASVGLQQVTPDHDFYNLKGSDNIILFYTTRYNPQPLIVKGAGAGADVTAAGVFADIIRIGKT